MDVSKQQYQTEFPYHPLVFHLDLSILAYHLYAQTLVWPFDPYYEELQGGGTSRASFMNKVRSWADEKGQDQARLHPTLGGYRGPGRLAGFKDNPLHDPILYRYDGLYPWNSTITNGGGRWIEYLTPKKITDQIRDVYMCYGRSGLANNAISVQRISSNKSPSVSSARDVLLAFEGGTGDKGEAGQPASQSLMGFVLLRHRPGGKTYDIHISFRGSRSGSLLRSVAQANWTDRARGNPDWITDLGYDLIGPDNDAGHITTTGRVHRGFARSMKSILPNAFACLNKAASLVPGRSPANIFVTGHSLGGGLAQQFASTVLLGDQYGPNGAGPAMPSRLRPWPWQQIKMISFSAPRAGDPLWAETLTTKGLASDFHSEDSLRYDYTALAVNDPGIPARLTDQEKPAGYRVLVSNDAISTSLFAGRKPVGKTVYADKLRNLAIFTPYNPDSHEPVVVRELMVASINDARIPETAWRYRDLAKATDGANRLNTTVQSRLEAEFLNYHQRFKVGFDHFRYLRDGEIFKNLLSAR